MRRLDWNKQDDKLTTVVCGDKIRGQVSTCDQVSSQAGPEPIIWIRATIMNLTVAH